MLGDILLIADKHRQAGKVIADHILTRLKERMIIGISGESGSGKSELAHVLAKEFLKTGKVTKILHTDNYYRTHPLERRQWRVQHGIENVVGYDEYDWDTLHRNMEDFRAGKISEMPCVDLVTQQVDRLITNFSEVQLLIVEGLYAIRSEKVDFRIFLELTYLETKEKHVKDERGKEVMDEVRWAILGQEHRMVSALQPMADVIVNKSYEVVFR